MELTLLTKRRILLLGFGVEHQALAMWLTAQGVSLTVRTADERVVAGEEYKGLLTVEHTQLPLQGLSAFDVLFRPGVLASSHPVLQRFEREGGTILTALQVLLSRSAARTIGVTGLRGKTLTASALEQLLRLTYQHGTVAAAHTAEAFSLLGELGDSDVLIVPIEDHELDGLEVAPSMLVCLDGGEQRVRLASKQRPSDTLFLSTHAEGAEAVRLAARGYVRELHVHQPRREAAWLAELETGRVLFWEHSGEVYSFALPGAQRGEAFALALGHAALVADTLGVAHEHIQAHLAQVSVAAHRLQVVAVHAGAHFVDDAAAGDASARTHALRAYGDERVHLITDGETMLHDTGDLASITLLPGISGKVLKAWQRYAREIGCEVFELAQQPTCLRQAISQLGSRLQEGDVVLFSPGAPARKPFRSAQERGAAFLEAIHLYASQA